jgi:1-aminocyclopropane-1-carboxylate synthase
MSEVTIEEERKLAWKIVHSGVWLATGDAFMSEEPGWFRITFSLPEEELRFGIGRLRKALGS